MREWYLIGDNTTPNMIGGFESQSFLEYKEDAFTESLQTEIATSVTLYNYDLSNPTEIRCIIQGNSADSQLKSMERVGLFVHNTVKAGMYIFFENRFWLITGYPSYNGIYEKAVMQLCQYKIRWQNSVGTIVERWASITSASKYDVGESGNSVIVLSSDNLTILLPDDEESLNLDNKRVFIDKRKTNPNKVYRITRTDGVLYDYGKEHGGILSFIADKTELNSNTDRPDIGICDYIEPLTNSPINPDAPSMFWRIELDVPKRSIRPTETKSIIVANLYDENGNKITSDVEYVWEIQSNVDEYLRQDVNSNTLTLSLSSDCEAFGEIISISCMSKNTGHTASVELEVEEVW